MGAAVFSKWHTANMQQFLKGAKILFDSNNRARNVYFNISIAGFYFGA